MSDSEPTGSEFMNAWAFYCIKKGYPWRDGFSYRKSRNFAKSRARLNFTGLNIKKGTVTILHYDKKGVLVKKRTIPIQEIMKFYNDDQAWTRRRK